MTKTFRIMTLIAILLLTACQPADEIDPERDAAEQIMTAAAATVEASQDTPEPTATESATTIENTPVPTMAPAYMVPATVTSQTLNLRAGPGTFFAIVQSYTRGTQVTTLEMTPDGRWIRVSAPGSEGWMAADFLDLSELQAALPVISWPEAYMIYGTVLDTQGNPISGVRMAATTGNQRAEATSTHDGRFYIYVPAEIAGPFNLEIVAVNCGSSIAEVQEDGSCRAADYFPVHWQETVTPPQSEPVRFTYEAGIAFLEGKVVYQDGNGASQILVRATRVSDSVQSEFVTPVGGEFRLPLGKGEWEVVAVRFLQDGTPLVSETRTYQITTAGQELDPLILPYTEIIDRN
ncbi:MAG: SH3 domain-containing protein [Anaerolineales bacterium]